MVWYIVTINTNVPRTTILFKPKTEIINPTDHLGGNYVLGFPSLGYVTLTDNGNTGSLKVALYELLIGYNFLHLVPCGDWSLVSKIQQCNQRGWQLVLQQGW